MNFVVTVNGKDYNIEIDGEKIYVDGKSLYKFELQPSIKIYPFKSISTYYNPEIHKSVLELTSQLFEQNTFGGKGKKKISHKTLLGGTPTLPDDSSIRKQINELGINFELDKYQEYPIIATQLLKHFSMLICKLFNVYPELKETYRNKKVLASNKNINILNKIVRRLYWQNTMNGFKEYLDAKKEEDTLIKINQPENCQNNGTDTTTHILFFKSKTISTIKLTNIDNTLVKTNNVKLHILHFDDDESSITTKINYFSSCLSKKDNVFITLSTVDFDATKFVKIRAVLENIISQIVYKVKVTVLNETNLWMLHNYENTHKVLNCFPYSENGQLNIKHYNNKEDNNDQPPSAASTFMKIKYDGKLGKTIDATSYPFEHLGKTYLIHYIKNHTVNTTDSFFISYCLRSPSCGKNRLFQVDGTCWFSAIINCFILTDSLKVLWEDVPVESTTYDNFIQYLQTTFNTTNLNTDFVNKISSNDIITRIFNDFDERAKRSIFIDFFNKIKKGMKIQDHIILPLSNLIEIGKNNGVVYNGFDYLIHLLKQSGDKYIVKKYEDILIGFGCIDYFIHTLTNKDQQSCPDIVLFATPGLGEFPREITGGSGIKYKLACSVLTFTVDKSGRSTGNVQRDYNHAISGLFCNDEPYLYNSWNITGRNAHWDRGLEWDHVGNYTINYSRLVGDQPVLDYFGTIDDPISLSNYDVVVYTIVK
jgi:hypothetical protein